MRTPKTLVLLALCLGAGPYQTLIPEIDSVSLDGTVEAFEPAPTASKRVKSALPDQLGTAIQNHFSGFGSSRLHVQLDRPMYRPGETVWFKTWALKTSDLSARQGSVGMQLIDPSGAVVASKQVAMRSLGAPNDFELPAAAPGGRWTVKAMYGSTTEEHAFVVSTYQAPVIQKKLEFMREAYGAGERVEALVELEHGTQGVLADHPVRAMLTVDGATVLDTELTTDDSGAVFVSGELPAELSAGDGLLTVLVEHGGISESISRRVPIVMNQLDLKFFPEGGDLVQGLEGRVYFEARDQAGEPADIEGFVVDDRGTRVADLRSVHDGLGRFGFVPRTGRRYHVEITAPAGVEGEYALPGARIEGCVLRSYDDFDSRHEAVRVGVRCSTPQDVVVTGFQRETLIDAAAVHAGPDNEAVVYLDSEAADHQGAVRVTVFDGRKNPLAERLVYRGAGRDLDIAIETDKSSYGPRDEVRVKVRARDAAGEPVKATVALSVVDDGVISLADDEEGHLLSRLYLRPELTEAPDDPAWYFDAEEPDARAGLDLVMGTKGWRRFDWRPVLNPPVPETTTAYRRSRRGGLRPMAAPIPDIPMAPMGGAPMEGMALDVLAGAAPVMDAAVMAPPPMAKQAQVMAEPIEAWDAEEPMGGEAFLGEMEDDDLGRDDRKAEREMPQRRARPIPRGQGRAGWIGANEELGALGYIQAGPGPVAVYREFPVPRYDKGFEGVRSDFRDTVFWAPEVQTDSRGRAEASFYLSDALTSFRITAEGIGGGQAGHAESTFTSVLPVSVAAKIPAVVSAGDRVDLPLTVTSTRGEPVSVDVDLEVGGKLVKARNTHANTRLGAGSAGTVWMPLDIGNGQDTVSLDVKVKGGGLTDHLQREIEVVQPGFPRSYAASGELADVQRIEFELEPHQMGSLSASVVLHPGPTSSLVEGLDGLIRTPGGCFEQTSSTNWPNVAILNYLETFEGNDRLRAKSAQALDVGYGRLTGFQVDAGGFETFGNGPGKEVLSAFGLLQFNDMKKVYPVSDKMLEEDVSFLLSSRDGKGGYTNSGESAHGFGSAPRPVSDGFITYALVSSGHHAVLDAEIRHQEQVAKTSKDPYVLALAVRTLNASGRSSAANAAKRLAALQGKDGVYTGAESSITRSYEANLDVESTALATMALMEAGGYRRQVDKGIEWLVAHRNGGTWGATQATAMALQALTMHAEKSKAPRSPGDFFVKVNGKDAGMVHYDADATDTIRIEGLEEHLKVGSNVIELSLDASAPLPFAFDAAWTSADPYDDPGRELDVSTTLSTEKVAMGETVRLTTEVTNLTDRIVPSPIARIGIPAGLEAPLWQLKQLQERGEIAYFETRPREITLYWEGLHVDDSHTIALDLQATVPGVYTGPATSAYPYYNDDEKGWAPGLTVSIARP